MSTQQPPRREVVTGVPRNAAHHLPRPARPAAGAPRPSTPEEDRLRALIRVQWRAAVVAAGALVVLLGSLPLVFAAVPAAAGARVDGVGIAWLLLGVLAYPLLYVIGRWYVRQAEANEARFAAGPDDGGPITARLPGERR